MSAMTERQSKAWPEAVAEAQKHVTSSTIPENIEDFWWRIVWDEESRPGRGQTLRATWCDGEYFVEVVMDVYGYQAVAVAETRWVHNSSDEECDCEPCEIERAKEEVDA